MTAFVRSISFLSTIAICSCTVSELAAVAEHRNARVDPGSRRPRGAPRYV
jgi:hypothetical protein